MKNRPIAIEHHALNTQVYVPHDMLPEFKQAFKRAISTWQDCSPEMRDFIDRLLGREKEMGNNMKD